MDHPTLDIYPQEPQTPKHPRHKEAFSVSLSDAQHFEREGFSGDILLDNAVINGANALQVTVEGKHPRKRMLAGTTRMYYVVSGEGTFTLNDDTKEVQPGDLFVVPPLNEYEYEGVMVLFEVNVSPANKFNDELVQTSSANDPESPVTIEYDIADSLTRQRNKIDRAGFHLALADVLANGYVLTAKDISEIGTHYGYAKTTGSQSLRSPFSRRDMEEVTGVKMVSTRYGGLELYRDSRLALDQTDYDHTTLRIDELRKQEAARRGRAPRLPHNPSERPILF